LDESQERGVLRVRRKFEEASLRGLYILFTRCSYLGFSAPVFALQPLTVKIKRIQHLLIPVASDLVLHGHARLEIMVLRAN
jgi:hypothetical protein